MRIVADENIPFVKHACESVGNVTLAPGREMNAQLVKDADALLVRSVTKVGPELLEGSKVKFVGTATIGVDHINQQYLNNKNITFASAPGSNANSVAEYITAAMLTIAHKHELALQSKKIGIIGVGNVGSRVEQKALALGMQPVLNDPPLKRQTNDQKYRPIEELFDCDFITLHTPLTREGTDKTYHLANDSFFEKLKQNTVFINSSRGGVTDTQALKKAVRSKKLRAVCLDVWENEPEIDTELLEMVDIATPHIAGYSFDGKVAGMMMIFNAMCQSLQIKTDFSIEPFLPEPLVPQMEVESAVAQDQELIRSTVEGIYDITVDDMRTRQMLKMEKTKRGAHFDSLRKNYPVRREFFNTKLIIKGRTDSFVKQMKGLGFNI